MRNIKFIDLSAAVNYIVVAYGELLICEICLGCVDGVYAALEYRAGGRICGAYTLAYITQLCGNEVLKIFH